MGEYLIDSNVISNYFSAHFPEKGMNLVSDIIDNVPDISVITQIEALSWINADKTKEAVINSFIGECNILSLTSDVAIQCIKIKRARKIKTPDAIIAATAIVNNLTLVTSDNDFQNIEGLKVIDPHYL